MAMKLFKDEYKAEIDGTFSSSDYKERFFDAVTEAKAKRERAERSSSLSLTLAVPVLCSIFAVILIFGVTGIFSPPPLDSSVPTDTYTENGFTLKRLSDGGIALISFEGSTADGVLTVPNGVTVIESSAFSNNTEITEVILPESVTLIKGLAFKNCVNLNKINFLGTAPEIEASAFEGTQINLN